jgi:cell division protein FtsL
MVRRIPSRQRNAAVARAREPGAFLRLALLLLCGLVLAGGFVYAGCQHFAALKFGYQTEHLRKVREELTENQRRFLLDREAAASPGRLERAARQLGMQPIKAAQIDPLKRAVKSSTEENSPAVKSAVSRNTASPPVSGQTKLIRLPASGRTEPAVSQSDSARTR